LRQAYTRHAANTERETRVRGTLQRHAFGDPNTLGRWFGAALIVPFAPLEAAAAAQSRCASEMRGKRDGHCTFCA